MGLDPTRDADFPFLAFRDDDGAYARAKLFWDDAFEEALAPEPAASWSLWIDDPFRDGHPIFSRINRRHRRGVLLQQVPPSDDPAWFKCWMARSEAEDGFLPYLFIETHVSRQGRVLFRHLTGAWCARLADEGEMAGLTEAARAAPDTVLQRLRHD